MTTAIVAVMQWAILMQPIADAADVDWRVGLAIVYVESRGQPDVASDCGAVGLMGVMPHFTPVGKLRDPETNLINGCAILRICMDAMGDDLRRALIAYHLGLVGAEQAGWERSIDGANYLTRFEAAWNELFTGRRLPWERAARPTMTGERE